MDPVPLEEKAYMSSQETIPQSLSSSEPSLASNQSLNDKDTSTLAQDLIIQQLLKNRPQMTDVNEEFERERQRRMYNMLRHSSHYKRMQVQIANSSWSGDPAQLLAPSNGLLNEDDLIEAQTCAETLVTMSKPQKPDRRVTFAIDSPTILQPDTPTDDSTSIEIPHHHIPKDAPLKQPVSTKIKAKLGQIAKAIPLFRNK